MLKKIKRVILWIAIIIALIIANGFYQSYQTKVLHERAMEMLGQSWDEIDRLSK